jgi:hypothetical protein
VKPCRVVCWALPAASHRRTWRGLTSLLGGVRNLRATAAQADSNQEPKAGGWLAFLPLSACAGAAAGAALSAAATAGPPRQWRGSRPAGAVQMSWCTVQAVGARCWPSLSEPAGNAGWQPISIRTRRQCCKTVARGWWLSGLLLALGLCWRCRQRLIGRCRHDRPAAPVAGRPACWRCRDAPMHPAGRGSTLQLAEPCRLAPHLCQSAKASWQ